MLLKNIQLFKGKGCPIKLFLNWILLKILYFWSNQVHIRKLLPFAKLIILTKFCKDGATFVDILSKGNFWTWELFSATPSMLCPL